MYATPCQHRHPFLRPFRHAVASPLRLRHRPARCLAAAQDGSRSVDSSLNGSLANGVASSSDSEDVSAQMKRLADRLAKSRRALQQSEERQKALAPYRVAPPKRGIVGTSKYAAALRKAVEAAAADRNRSPVLIFGEPGLYKTDIAAIIHFNSTHDGAPVVAIDCDRLEDGASELVGRGPKRGILSWLPNNATLILNNVHKAPPAVLPLLQQEVAVASLAASMSSMDSVDFDDEDNESLQSIAAAAGASCALPSSTAQSDVTAEYRPPAPCRFPRIIMTAETRVPELEKYATLIKVPPLRLRPEDIEETAQHYLWVLGKQRGLGVVQLSRGALRRLEAAPYPNNIRELKGVLERAVAQSVRPSSTEAAIKQEVGTEARPLLLSEDTFWFANPAKERLRLDLLASMPPLRSFLRSDVWPKGINYNFTAYAFAAVVALLFLGPQDREHNVALNVFWCVWWPGIFVVYPFLGRIWCSVCPFMIYGELAQKLRVATGAKLRKWPKETLERVGPWFLFGLFAAILVWEEVWDLPNTAALSSWLLLLITAGAVLGSVFYERRVWCRYLCPIGGMNGMFAKLSLTELRARQGVCSAECSTYACYKGGPQQPPEGLETGGCPLYSHPAQLTDNRNCVLCMECLKACPNQSIQLSFRVPGSDLWDGTHTPLAGEVALMFMLLGAVYLHDLPTVLNAYGVAPSDVMSSKLPHIAASLAVLAAPGALAWGVDAAWRQLSTAFRPEGAPAPLLSTSSSSGDFGDSGAARAVSVLKNAASTYSAEQAGGAATVAPVKPFVELAYGFLPLVWAATLAYYLDNFLLEAGHILPVAAATFGANPPPAFLPSFEVHPAVSDAMQATLLAGGAALSLGMMRRVSRQNWFSVAPHCGLVLLFTTLLWHDMIH